jgi:hypothetical protein
VFIEHPPKNSMASFRFTSTMLDEGTTFIFGSWICIANSSGGFNNHLADSRNMEASTSTRHSDLDEFIDNLDELLLPDLAQQIERMSVFDATLTHVRSDSNRSEETTQSESLSDLEEDLDCLPKLEDMGATACREVPSSTTTWTPTKSTHRLVLHLQAIAEEDSRMREPPLVGRPPLSTTTRNLMTTPNPFRVVTWV